MKRHDIRSIYRWHAVQPGEILEFAAPPEGRHVVLQVNSPVPVALYISDAAAATRVLLAADVGLFEVSCTIDADAHVELEASDTVYIAGITGDQVVEPTTDEVYTGILPMGRRNSDYDRMVMLMKLNEKRRDEQLRHEIEKVRAAARADDDEDRGKVKYQKADASDEDVTEADPAPEAEAPKGKSDGK